MGAQLTNEISNNKTATPTPQAPTASIRLQKYRYYIVPPINLNLMEIFEKQAYLEEENIDGSGTNMPKFGTQQNAQNKFKNPHIPVNRQDERTYVHLCWIYMWCGTLWQQDKKEQLFRTNQLL